MLGAGGRHAPSSAVIMGMARERFLASVTNIAAATSARVSLEVEVEVEVEVELCCELCCCSSALLPTDSQPRGE